jgi:hypothetical protein
VNGRCAYPGMIAAVNDSGGETMSHWPMGMIVLVDIWVAPAIAADEPKGTLTRDERQQRLAFLNKTLADYVFEVDRDPPLSLTSPQEPVLAFTNPVRSEVGGATFFLLRQRRPMAAASISIRPQGRVVHEFTLLGDEPIAARRQGKVAWSPRKNGRSFASIEGVEAPAASAALRLAQMRSLARQFRVRVLRANPFEARLLPQPLSRYANPDAKSQDGAVFAFVEVTDPEVFLMLEARAEDAHPKGHWLFSLARMTSQPIEVHQDDRLIWAVAGYYRNPRFWTILTSSLSTRFMPFRE